MVPLARALADRGHEVAVFNPAPAPGRLIAEARLTSLPMPACPMPAPVFDPMQLSQAWDVEHFFGCVYTQEAYVRDTLAAYLSIVRDYAPDVVIDSFDPLFCLAARVLKKPLVTVLQGNFHPASRGFLWWENERPAGLASAAPFINNIGAEYGLPALGRCSDLMAGDLSLIVGTPETDPVDATPNIKWIGPMVFQRSGAELPAWINELSRDKQLVWVYSGNPRYAPFTTPIDSIVVIRAAIETLANEPVDVVLTTGYQELPEEFGELPRNFHLVDYVPGPLMAERADLIVFHGGHSSVMTSLMTGTPSVIIPTISERESNARRLASLGAGEVVRPVTDANGEKQIDRDDFASKIRRVLREPRYRQSARRVAESMRQYGGAKAAAITIEEFAATRQRASQ
jgi:MGT family glycosyltransferase